MPKTTNIHGTSGGSLTVGLPLTDAELKAFGTYLSRVDPKLPPAAQPFARNMVQQIDAKLAGTFNPEKGKFEKYFNAQLVRFVMAGGTL